MCLDLQDLASLQQLLDQVVRVKQHYLITWVKDFQKVQTQNFQKNQRYKPMAWAMEKSFSRVLGCMSNKKIAYGNQALLMSFLVLQPNSGLD